MKSIKVEDPVWERLQRLKLKHKFRSLSKLIDVMSKVIKYYKPEMEDKR